MQAREKPLQLKAKACGSPISTSSSALRGVRAPGLDPQASPKGRDRDNPRHETQGQGRQAGAVGNKGISSSEKRHFSAGLEQNKFDRLNLTVAEELRCQTGGRENKGSF